MTIHRIWRLCCLTVASFFWASCDSDSSTQATDSDIPEPDSSADYEKSSSSEGASVSSSAAESSSSETSLSSSSLAEKTPGSSAENAPSSSETEISSSSDVASSASTPQFVLARDASVTCRDSSYKVAACSSTKGLTCDDYKKYLAKDTTLSKSLLTEWEDKLQKCGAIEEFVALYGIAYDPCATATKLVSVMKCSDGSTYKDFVQEENLIYTSTEEYNEAHGISSSSVAESSSSESEPEDLVKNCPHEDFALFVDVLADVHKKLYNEIVSGIFYEKYEVGEKIPDAGKQYIESLLDHENESLKGKYTPYFDPDYDYDEMMTSLRGLTNFWFDGYVAKTETCEDGTSKTVQLYLNHYNSIYGECAKMIREKAMSLKDPA